MYAQTYPARPFGREDASRDTIELGLDRHSNCFAHQIVGVSQYLNRPLRKPDVLPLDGAAERRQSVVREYSPPLPPLRPPPLRDGPFRHANEDRGDIVGAAVLIGEIDQLPQRDVQIDILHGEYRGHFIVVDRIAQTVQCTRGFRKTNWPRQWYPSRRISYRCARDRK